MPADPADRTRAAEGQSIAFALVKSPRAVGYGAEAERFISHLAGECPVIAADLTGGVLALAESVERRRSGEMFYAAPLVDDPRAMIAQRVSGPWIEALRDIDARYRAFDALAADQLSSAGCEMPSGALDVIDEASRRVLRDFAVMGDALLVRSSRDVERISRILGRRRPSIVAAPGIDPTIPSIEKRTSEVIVVWAPCLEASALGVIAMALEYMKVPVVYVCAQGRLTNVRGDFVGIADATAALEKAACVVDAGPSDPATAIALQRVGAPIVAAATAGVSEFLDGVYEYEPWDWRSIFAAVSAARASTGPVVKREFWPVDELHSTLQRNAPPKLSAEPRVSIVMATYNRRDRLPRMLDALADQTYKNFEVIVVNDAGEDVSDLVARYHFASLIEVEENSGCNAALAVGLKHITGEYFGFIADDDDMFPDHIARLAAALEVTGADVAHTNSVTRYVSMKTGMAVTLAFRVRCDRTPDRLQLLVGGTALFGSMLFRRRILSEVGPLDAGLLPADYEYQLRLAQRYDSIHVDVVTYDWYYNVDGTSLTHEASDDLMVGGLRAVYERYPSGGSEIVERRRAFELQRHARRDEGVLWAPDLLLPTVPPESVPRVDLTQPR